MTVIAHAFQHFRMSIRSEIVDDLQKSQTHHTAHSTYNYTLANINKVHGVKQQPKRSRSSAQDHKSNKNTVISTKYVHCFCLIANSDKFVKKEWAKIYIDHKPNSNKCVIYSVWLRRLNLVSSDADRQRRSNTVTCYVAHSQVREPKQIIKELQKNTK